MLDGRNNKIRKARQGDEGRIEGEQGQDREEGSSPRLALSLVEEDSFLRLFPPAKDPPPCPGP
jgi:hypothetical protein